MQKPNVNLLAKVQSQVLSQPSRFNIEDFSTDIAGLSVAAAGLSSCAVDAFTEARKVLRVSRNQLEALCLLHLWPRQFRQRFEPEPTSTRALKANARVVVDRIDYFVQEGC